MHVTYYVCILFPWLVSCRRTWVAQPPLRLELKGPLLPSSPPPQDGTHAVGAGGTGDFHQRGRAVGHDPVGPFDVILKSPSFSFSWFEVFASPTHAKPRPRATRLSTRERKRFEVLLSRLRSVTSRKLHSFLDPSLSSHCVIKRMPLSRPRDSRGSCLASTSCIRKSRRPTPAVSGEVDSRFEDRENATQ